MFYDHDEVHCVAATPPREPVVNDETREAMRAAVEHGIYVLEANASDPSVAEYTQAAVDALAPLIDRLVEQARAEAWDKGFSRGFYDVLAGGDRDACESAAVNPYDASTGEGAALARQVARMRRAQGVSLTGEGDRG